MSSTNINRSDFSKNPNCYFDFTATKSCRGDEVEEEEEQDGSTVRRFDENQALL